MPKKPREVLKKLIYARKLYQCHEVLPKVYMTQINETISIIILGVLISFHPAAGNTIELVAAGDRPMLVFEPGEEIGFRIKTTEKENLSIKVTNIQEKVVFESRGQEKVSFHLQERGFFRIKVVLKNGEKVVAEAGKTFAILPRSAEIPNDLNPFGVNFHLTRIPLAEAEREISLARRAGFGWGRGMLFDWYDMPAPRGGSYAEHFKTYDGLLVLLKQSGLSVVGGIYYFPRWASGAPKDGDFLVWSRILPEDMKQVTLFCEAYGRYCRDLVRYWEVGNEVDADLFWKGRYSHFMDGNDEDIIRDYVDFLRAAGEGFRAGNSSAQILFAGLTGPEGGTYRPFLDTALKVGAGPLFKIMNAHYGSSIDRIRELFKKNGVPDRPVWITEIGGPSNRTIEGERKQIFYDITQSVIQLASGGQRIFKYDLRDDGENGGNSEDNYGLVYRDFSPKPSYAAYATLIRLLAGTAFRRELNVVKECDRGWLQGYEFHSLRDKKPLHVLWVNNAKKSLVTLSTPNSALRTIDIMGNERTLAADKGKVSFTIDELPFFIQGAIQDKPGRPEYPVAREVRSVVLVKEKSCIPIVVRQKEADWKSFFTRRVLKKDFPLAGKDHFLTVSAEARVGIRGVDGRGASLVCSFYGIDGKRISWRETPFRVGTRAKTLWQTGESEIPPGTEWITVDLYLSPGSVGEIWMEDVKVLGHIWQKAGRD